MVDLEVQINKKMICNLKKCYNYYYMNNDIELPEYNSIERHPPYTLNERRSFKSNDLFPECRCIYIFVFLLLFMSIISVIIFIRLK